MGQTDVLPRRLIVIWTLMLAGEKLLPIPNCIGGRSEILTQMTIIKLFTVANIYQRVEVNPVESERQFLGHRRHLKPSLNFSVILSPIYVVMAY